MPYLSAKYHCYYHPIPEDYYPHFYTEAWGISNRLLENHHQKCPEKYHDMLYHIPEKKKHTHTLHPNFPMFNLLALIDNPTGLKKMSELSGIEIWDHQFMISYLEHIMVTWVKKSSKVPNRIIIIHMKYHIRPWAWSPAAPSVLPAACYPPCWHLAWQPGGLGWFTTCFLDTKYIISIHIKKIHVHIKVDILDKKLMDSIR